MAAVHRGKVCVPPLWGQQMVDYGKPVGHLHQLPLSVNYYCRNHL